MEPWDIKIDDTRSADNTRSFIIFCEDGEVEPTYFELFKKKGLHISALGNTKQHHAQVDYCTECLRKADLLEVNDLGNEVLKLDDGAQVWCVFDRDKELGDGKDTAFNDSIKAADDKGIRVAWSNDDFKLWILLHFEMITPEDTDYKNRKKYYERLTSILKSQYPDDPKFSNPNFDYYNTMKSKKNFLTYTYLLMKDKCEVAIERAESLAEYHSQSRKPLHLHCPCTKVHHLVKKLIN